MSQDPARADAIEVIRSVTTKAVSLQKAALNRSRNWLELDIPHELYSYFCGVQMCLQLYDRSNTCNFRMSRPTHLRAISGI